MRASQKMPQNAGRWMAYQYPEKVPLDSRPT